jgi:hypothetical protein
LKLPVAFYRRFEEETALSRSLLLAGVVLACLLVASNGHADWDIHNSEEEPKKITDGTLTLMAFTVLPYVTTSSISITNPSSNDPGLRQTTLGGGFTVSDRFPLYLEGTIGYSQYDPDFVATRGQEQRRIPLKWNSSAATGGIGWDFPIIPSGDLSLRPLFCVTLGNVSTDVAIIKGLLEAKYDWDLSSLDDGTMNAYGLGGGVMLDYEHYGEAYEIDVELRYAFIKLHSFGGTTDLLEGNSEANSANLWARWRAPTGLRLLKRPLRYVLEASGTSFFGPQRGALGFDHLASTGAGIELDISAYVGIITRMRLIGRYLFGDSVSGYSFGLGVSW